MLITVKKPKLVLGRTVYLKGDTFECRDAEAKLLVASGIATKADVSAKATKESPTPPTTGMSKKPGTPPASKQTAAPRVQRKKLPPVSPTMKPSALTSARPATAAPAPVAPAPVAPVSTQAAATPPAGNPVGAITMPQSGGTPHKV